MPDPPGYGPFTSLANAFWQAAKPGHAIEGTLPSAGPAVQSQLVPAVTRKGGVEGGLLKKLVIPTPGAKAGASPSGPGSYDLQTASALPAPMPGPAPLAEKRRGANGDWPVNASPVSCPRGRISMTLYMYQGLLYRKSRWRLSSPSRNDPMEAIGPNIGGPGSHDRGGRLSRSARYGNVAHRV